MDTLSPGFERISQLAAALLSFHVATLNAQESEATPGATPGATPAQTEAIRVDATDEDALRQHLGKKVTVIGTIEQTRDWDGGANFLNFAGGKCMLICFESEYANFPDGKPANTLRHKRVEVTGYLSEYKGKPQIKLIDPSQIKVVTAEATAKPGSQPADQPDRGKAPDAAPATRPDKVDPAKYFC